MQIVKPTHNSYILHTCSENEYRRIVCGYQKAKKFGFRTTVGYLIGQNIGLIAYEIGKGQIRYYARRKVGCALISGISWVAGPIGPMVTNSTKVIKGLRIAHSCVSFGFEVCEDISCAWMLPIDLVVFGQPIPIGNEGRFNVMSKSLDILEDK
jgi:hypothetical protein